MFGTPDRVYAGMSFGKYYDIEVEDDVLAYFEYDNGATGEYNRINTNPFGMPEYRNCEIPCDLSDGDQHVGILKNFSDAILEGKELLAKGVEGICGLTISNAMHLSAWTGETVDVKHFPDDRFYKLLQDKIKNSTIVKKKKKVIVDINGTF